MFSQYILVVYRAYLVVKHLIFQKDKAYEREKYQVRVPIRTFYSFIIKVFKKTFLVIFIFHFLIII